MTGHILQECENILEQIVFRDISIADGEQQLNKIIKSGAVTKNTVDEFGDTLLHKVAYNGKQLDYERSGDLPIIDWVKGFIRRLIVEEGYDPNTKNGEGKTLLFCFTTGLPQEQVWYTFMQELIESYGADPLIIMRHTLGIRVNLRQYIDRQWLYDSRTGEVIAKPFLDFLKEYERKMTGQIKPTVWSVHSLKL